MKSLIVLSFVFTSTCFASLGDKSGQCKFLSKKQVMKARSIILGDGHMKQLHVIDRYCEACLDRYPKPIVVNKVKASFFKGKKSSSLLINDVIEDLAYIYISGENLAKKIGCQALAVSNHID